MYELSSEATVQKYHKESISIRTKTTDELLSLKRRAEQKVY